MSSSRRTGIGPGDRSKDITRTDNTTIQKPVNLKKNRDALRNEIMKVSQLLSFIPNSYGDRYISRRYNKYDPQQNFVRPVLMNGFDKCDDDFVQVKYDDGFWRPYALRESLKTSIKMSKETVLHFHDYLTKDFLNKSLDRRFASCQNTEMTANKQKFDWPCLPRRRAIAATEISHVLSNYCFYSDLSVITWSRAGKMTASFGEDLVIWIPKGKSSITYELKGITCLAYNFDGKYLAVGTKLEEKLPQIQIWDLSSDSVGVFITSWKYSRRKDEVRSVIWDPKNSFIVSGTLSGNVYVHNCSISLRILKTLVCAKLCINTVQISANQMFLSAADKGGNVFVWNMQTYESVFKWSEKGVNRALIAWHPWKETYLIIATRLPASIRLIDVRAHEMIAHYNRTDELCRIDAITFSPRSAELVVSVTIFDDAETSYEILVLASLDRVVDLLSIHDGCVKCLLWNADGSMLATAGNDNMLNVWNFFGHSKFGPVKSNPKQNYVNSKFMLGNPSMLR
ncbi:protein cortex [Bradysia coprophila]|uniref:protein cortex n=1 Tax=Bradysia coprophila TaxID=38358 RepID=UPI00187D8789|nr:protein cortex [Bradysia coprophila]